MHNALKRLLELRDELELLHQTTARVLAESEQLIAKIHEPQLLPTDKPRADAGARAPRSKPPRKKPQARRPR